MYKDNSLGIKLRDMLEFAKTIPPWGLDVIKKNHEETKRRNDKLEKKIRRNVKLFIFPSVRSSRRKISERDTAIKHERKNYRFDGR